MGWGNSTGNVCYTFERIQTYADAAKHYATAKRMKTREPKDKRNGRVPMECVGTATYRGTVYLYKRDTKRGSIYFVRDWGKHAVVAYLPDGRIRVKGPRTWTGEYGYNGAFEAALRTHLTPIRFTTHKYGLYAYVDGKYYRVGLKGLYISPTGVPMNPIQECKKPLNRSKTKALKEKYKGVYDMLKNICTAIDPKEAHGIYTVKRPRTFTEEERKAEVFAALEGDSQSILNIVGMCVQHAYIGEEWLTHEYRRDPSTGRQVWGMRDTPQLIQKADLPFSRANYRLKKIMYGFSDVCDIVPVPIGVEPQGRGFEIEPVRVVKKKGRKK